MGNLAKINPPLRSGEDSEAIWEAVKAGTIDTVGSDHAATRAQKHGDIWDAAPGFPGVSTLLPVLVSEGVHKRGLSLPQVARLTSYNAARVFNLYPRKGKIQVGADADLAVVDLDLERKVNAAALGSSSDFSIYEGWTLKGWPVLTLLRGRIVAKDQEQVSEPGAGRFLARYPDPA